MPRSAMQSGQNGQQGSRGKHDDEQVDEDVKGKYNLILKFFLDIKDKIIQFISSNYLWPFLWKKIPFLLRNEINKKLWRWMKCYIESVSNVIEWYLNKSNYCL